MTTDPGNLLEVHRTALAMAWRLLGRLSLVDTIFNHISVAAEVPSGHFHLLINPEGVLPSELRPEAVRVLPLRTYLPSESAQLKINPDGLHLHSLIHASRQRPGAIIHLHRPYCLAVGCSEQGLLPLTQTAMEFSGDVQTFGYAGVFRSQTLTEEMENLANRGGAALLRNHGVLAVADTIEEAFYMTYYLEEACKLQVLAFSQGVPLVGPAEAVVEETHLALRADRGRVALELFRALARTLGA